MVFLFHVVPAIETRCQVYWAVESNGAVREYGDHWELETSMGQIANNAWFRVTHIADYMHQLSIG